MPKTIAIDYTPALNQSAGIGRLVRELISELARTEQTQNFRLFVSGQSRRFNQQPPGANFTWKPTPISDRWLARLWHKLRIPLPIETFTGGVDLYHATDFVLPPTLKRTRTIVTVHDLSFVHVPEAASPRLKVYLDQVVPSSVHRADHVLADSEATRQDVINLYKVKPDKVTTLYSGVNASFRAVDVDLDYLSRKYNIPKYPFIFSIGTVQPRKNYIRLIQAVAKLREQKVDVNLVIAGGKGWLEDPIYAEVNRLQLADHVHFIGFADDADLPMLYSAARCVAYASLYEGFGFPVLEGMACGTPVVTSNVSSLPEVAGNSALMVDPYNVDQLADALKTAIVDEDIRTRMIETGLEQAGQFTWQDSAHKLLQVYNSLLGE